MELVSGLNDASLDLLNFVKPSLSNICISFFLGFDVFHDFGSVFGKSSDCHGEEDKRFACENCDRKYKYAAGLWRHRKYECGKEPIYECYVCFRKFHHRPNLKTHVLTVHNQPYEQRP